MNSCPGLEFPRSSGEQLAQRQPAQALTASEQAFPARSSVMANILERRMWKTLGEKLETGLPEDPRPLSFLF